MDSYAGDFKDLGDTFLLTHIVSGGVIIMRCHETDRQESAEGIRKGARMLEEAMGIPWILLRAA